MSSTTAPSHEDASHTSTNASSSTATESSEGTSSGSGSGTTSESSSVSLTETHSSSEDEPKAVEMDNIQQKQETQQQQPAAQQQEQQQEQPAQITPKKLEEGEKEESDDEEEDEEDEETKGCCPSKGWKFRAVWVTSGLVVLLMSALQHFLHEWIPCPFIAVWAPVSESVWEHTKLVYYSTAVWWAVVFAVARRRWRLDWLRWMLACTVDVYFANTVMVALFFVAYSGLGITLSLGLDIFFEAVALYAGFALGHHVYKHCTLRTTVPAAVAVALVFAAPILAYAIINYHVPQVDLFVVHNHDHDHDDGSSSHIH